MGGTLYWDFPRQFGDILAGLERAAEDGPVASVAVDTWGVDYGFIDARGRLLANPVHYRDTRHEKMPEVAFEMVPREEIYAATGIQFMSINTLFQLLSEVRAQDPLLGPGRPAADDAGPLQPLPLRQRRGRVHRGHHEPVPGPLDARLGPAALRAPGHPHALPARGRAAGHGPRRAAARAWPSRPASPARRSWPWPRTTPPLPWPARRWRGRRPPTSRRAPGRSWAWRCASRSWTSGPWPPTSPTRAATTAPSRCSRTSWACGSCSSAAAHCGARTSGPPTRSSRP